MCMCSCSEVQGWDVWWQNMRIVRGRTRGIDGSNFYGCLILICVSGWSDNIIEPQEMLANTNLADV